MCLQFSLVAGTTASTNIAITGITTSDELLFVLHLSTAASIATALDDTANCSITSAGNIQSATDTSNDQLLVIWNKLNI
jgi:hypothetical protein